MKSAVQPKAKKFVKKEILLYSIMSGKKDVAVVANVYGNLLAVHPSYECAGWTLTHVPTGLRIFSYFDISPYTTLRDGRRMAIDCKQTSLKARRMVLEILEADIDLDFDDTAAMPFETREFLLRIKEKYRN